ncbi:GntR family transcriptional regulator [Thioflexithrix psekupsensis]|nr:GntR family transcriptional regulator [Thioflexithrix psekupsensis]
MSMDFNAAPCLAEQIADYLGDLIIRGHLQPGERIQEVKVTKELKVSRGSVREALLLLERRYLVQNVPRKGAIVATLTHTDIRGLYNLLGCLYALLGRDVVETWQTEEDLLPFDALIAEIEAAAFANDSDKLFCLSFGFSNVAKKLVGNTFLNQTLENLRPVFSRIYYQIVNHDPNELIFIADFLKKSMQLVRARAADENRELVKQYFERQCQVALSLYPDLGQTDKKIIS